MLLTAKEANDKLAEKAREKEEKRRKCYFRNPYNPDDLKMDEEYVNNCIKDSIKMGFGHASFLRGILTEHGFKKLKDAGYHIIKNYPFPTGLDPNNEFTYVRGTRICFSDESLQENMNELSHHCMTGWEIMTSYE